MNSSGDLDENLLLLGHRQYDAEAALKRKQTEMEMHIGLPQQEGKANAARAHQRAGAHTWIMSTIQNRNTEKKIKVK